MDFAYTEDQHELVRLARQIFTDRVTHESLTEIESRDGERFDQDLWRTLAEAGLLGIALPADLGGGGYGPLEQCLVLEQAARVLAPVPLHATAVMGAWTIATFGTEAQRERWIPRVAAGDAILTAALASSPGAQDPAAEDTGSGWHLKGTRTGVPAATMADLILIPAGGHVFLVPKDTPGLTITPQRTTARDTTGLLTLDLTLPYDARLNAPDIEDIKDMATLGLCAQQLGVTSRALEAAADYTTRRHQFGRPIGSFQAVGHRLADCHIDVEAIRLTTWQAAWLLSPEAKATKETRSRAVATAKFWAADGGHRVAHAVVHVHGGMGIAEEYFVHRYFLHAKQLEFTLGGATEQALRLGAMLASTPLTASITVLPDPLAEV
ncbi:acyl-CoA dehydrogenase family protein [Sphaerisporangium aureirubrum]|uniref:Acyl-CoA dehydrogenase family protein n=1 Tax=Sphaerisporangium aureirubrum TaxID=1544736 RepID=A0ABW1NS34_9ACTN